MAVFRREKAPLAPRVVGRAGMGLESAGWAASEGAAAAGRKGELRTASELHKLLLAGGSGPTVMHDLMLPVRGVRANIDHVVVSGRDVWLLDSKFWRPGTYWTFRHHTRRGWEKFASGDKQTYLMAYESLTGLLAANNVRAKVHRPVLVVWSSSGHREPNLVWYRPKGAKTMAGGQLARFCQRARKPAAADIVWALARLATDKTALLDAQASGGQHANRQPVRGPVLDVPEDWLPGADERMPGTGTDGWS